MSVNGIPDILVVEDDPAQGEILKYNLEAEGYHVRLAEDGDTALVEVKDTLPDVIVLDWMLPGVSGIEICRQVKVNPKTASIPIVMLSARGEEFDRVRGLETGADDYVVKPYSLAELMARVKTQLRRSRPASVGVELTHGDIRLDPKTRRVFRGEKEIRLGPTEYRLLLTFLERDGRVLSREQLLDMVWGQDIYVNSRTVDVHVGRLRKALTANGAKDPLRTVRGAGYSLG